MSGLGRRLIAGPFLIRPRFDVPFPLTPSGADSSAEVTGGCMNVFACSAPNRPDWRWRIVSSTGNIVEESHDGFRTAVATGPERLAQLNVVDDEVPGMLHVELVDARTHTRAV
jgi:hypothetical protein